MEVRRIGIILNGVTGRMGTNQHLDRSIAAIIKQGGVKVSPDLVLMPDPILTGRSETKLKALAEKFGHAAQGKPFKYTTDVDGALAGRFGEVDIFFDASGTLQRAGFIEKAAQAGKAIYCEKPTAVSTAEAVRLARLVEKAGLKNGVVQDKLWLPGLMKVKELIHRGFFGRILSVRGEFGYWVFEGDTIPLQRPSWNYRREDGGGMVVDMHCHWRYVLDHVFGAVKSVSCLTATHLPERWDENGKPYACTADDAAYSTFQLEGGIIAHFNSSWTVRVRRDDLLTLQIDGTHGSAVAGLREVWIQPYGATPRPVWNPDVPQPLNFFEGWQKVPEQRTYDNAFKVQWELFLRHVALGESFPWGLMEGAKGVQLAELSLASHQQRAWVEVPELK